ncbi:MAG TPA: RIP metalloprotease RseP [Bryobacteraceae bacterium]|nr:RIP metalloprotease RseP [Bryobacteraceae bacterium]
MIVLQNIWWLLVLIGVMIIIHELGHYWAARFFDVRVDAFSFGFGPRLFGFKKGETDFRFSAILFGGYVKMAGEQPGDENANDPRAFLAKPRWQRLIIAFAGPFMNIILAVAVLTGLFMVHFPKLPNNPDPVIGAVAQEGAAAKAGIREGDKIVQIDNTADPTWEDVFMREGASAGHPIDVWVLRDGKRLHFVVTPTLEASWGTGVAGWAEQSPIEVSAVRPEMPAAKAGLKAGDILVSANGQPIRSVVKLLDITNGNPGKPVDLVYSRDGKQSEAIITPIQTNEDGAAPRWVIGVNLQPQLVITQLALPQALAESIRQNAKSASLIYGILRGIIERKMSTRSLSGPITIARMSGEAAREGPGPFFGLMAMVSLNLAVFNMLPIPILDGGVILLLLIEMFMRRDLSLQMKEAVFKVGFVFLMAVVVFVIYNDISKLAG